MSDCWQKAGTRSLSTQVPAAGRQRWKTWGIGPPVHHQRERGRKRGPPISHHLVQDIPTKDIRCQRCHLPPRVSALLGVGDKGY